MTAASVNPLWEEASTCDACGDGRWRSAGAIRGHRYGRCEGCGVVRLVDRVAESALGLLYAHYYETSPLSAEMLERQLENPTFSHRLQRIEAQRGARTRRMFELGCGDGNFLAFMRRAGWAVDGSEFGASSVALVRHRHGLAIMEGDATVQRPSSAPYPVVAAYHVFEHIYHPADWLRRVHTLIEPGGLLCLQTPNWESLAHSLTGLSWSSMTFPEHVYLYSPSTLRAMLPRFGFDVLSLTTWDPWHGPGTAAGSLGSRAKQLMTGRLPWTDVLDRSAPSATPSPPAQPGRRGAARLALDLAGGTLARAEALVGRGAVVDVIARRVP